MGMLSLAYLSVKISRVWQPLQISPCPLLSSVLSSHSQTTELSLSTDVAISWEGENGRQTQWSGISVTSKA